MTRSQKNARLLSLSQILHLTAGLGAGTGLCLLLLKKISIHNSELEELLHRISWEWFLLGLALTLALWGTGAIKWQTWNKGEHSPKTPTILYRNVAWQMWWGQFLPSALAVVVGRSWAERATEHGWRQGAKSGFFDQAFEFLILAGLLPTALLILLYQTEAWIYLPLGFMGMAAATGVILMGTALFPRLLPTAQHKNLPVLLFLSSLRVILIVGRTLVFIPLFGFDIPVALVIAASPLLAILFVVPLTPANLGISEWGWVGVLGFAGQDPAQAALFALGSRCMIIVFQSLLLFLYETALWLKRSSAKLFF